MSSRVPNKNKRRSTQRDGARGGGGNRGAPSSYSSAAIFDDDPERMTVLGITVPVPLALARAKQSLPAPLANLTPARLLLLGGAAFVLLAPAFNALLHESARFLRGSAASAADENGVIGDALPHVTNDGKFHGRYPNSLLTLFYPFTLFRDVVLDQPVDPADVPFFWHEHVSDERAVKTVLTKCYDADLVELNSVEDVEKAKRLNLVSTLASQGRIGPEAVNKERLWNGQRRKPLVIASPHVREAAELFSIDNFGRMFSFYRHPIDYDVHPSLKKKLPPEAGANNFLTRFLSDVHTGPLGFKELGIAKQVIRQTTVAGTRDLMAESLFRIGKYYGWVPVGGEGTKDGEARDDAIAESCIKDVIKDVPGERYADHNSPEWQVFYKANKLDCQLYEIARSTWRAQIQTIIPLSLQKQRAGEADEDEKEEEGG